MASECGWMLVHNVLHEFCHVLFFLYLQSGQSFPSSTVDKGCVKSDIGGESSMDAGSGVSFAVIPRSAQISCSHQFSSGSLRCGVSFWIHLSLRLK